MQIIRFILIFLCIFFVTNPSYSAIKGGVGYSIPIDYSHLNAVELAEKADFYYNNVIVQKSSEVDVNVTTALNLYTMLANRCPENIQYPVRLGILYDMIGKDRYAKGAFYRAIGINKNNPEPYFYLGEFFFQRQIYRRALKMYLEAYNKGFRNDIRTLNRLNQLYLMFGDRETAEKYAVSADK